MSVRDSGYRPRSPRRRLPILPALVVVAVLLAIAIPFGGGLLGGAPSPSSPAGAVASATPSTASTATAPTPDPAAPTPAPETPAPTAAPPTPAVAQVAIVPVTHFRSPLGSAVVADVEALASGAKGRFAALVLVETDADAILERLGTDRASLGTRLVTVGTADELAADLAAHRDRLAFLRADDVVPGVRALAWGKDALFGIGRVATLEAWPLKAPLLVDAAEPGYDPAAAWTMVAGGDILLDRGVTLAIKGSKRGEDFPFDGGTVTITGRCKDCSAFGWDLPYTKRTGNAGVVRDLLVGADLTIANFENPAPDKPRWHSKGTVFNANPAYLDGLVAAGIDWVSLANNHIGDAGRNGILQTMENLDEVGIAHGGTGRNATEARRPSILEVRGTKVAILAYDAIAPGYHATSERIGSAKLSAKAVEVDVRKARDAGADVVIVFPHWGTEYRAVPSQSQRAIAHAAIDAGADMVIGNHAHWAAAIESYKGRPIWYALGNLVFDQTWSEPTMEGVTLELTFEGGELVQVNMRPHLILDRAQPNFMDPAKAGKVVMDQMWKGSKGLLGW